MKKFYLPLMCMGFLSSTLFSQDTYITGNVPVKVQPHTLFYHGGDLVVTAGVTNGRVIVNDGNIKINGDFSNNAVAPAAGEKGKNFVNTYTDDGNYGQVIINDGSTSAGMLTMEKQSIDPGAFTWGQFAIPYEFASAGDAFQTLFGLTYQGGSRYNHSIMTWDNTTRPEYDHIPSGTALNPTDYVLLNLATDVNLIDYMDGGLVTLPYAGKPANGIHNVSFRPDIYPTTPWSTWKSQKNVYNERYETYIEEHIRVPQSTDHGRYYFQFGNPYTSNIDLSFIGTDAILGDTDDVYVEDLLGVVKITSMKWNNTDGVEFDNVSMARATWDGSQWGGSADALIIKPFEGFYIGLKSTASRTPRIFKFNDGLKTFFMTPALTPDSGAPVPAGKYVEEPTGDFTGTEVAGKSISSSMSVLSTSARSAFYQLKLSLYTEEGVSTGNDVYVIVDSKSQTGVAQPLESDYTDFTSGFFLTQENANGSVVASPNRVMQINAVHPKYVAKPIQLFFKKNPQDLNGHYLKAELFYKNIFTKLGLENVNYADGNSFFFYDKIQDVLLPITTDFSYYIERIDKPMYDGYAVYWNGGPETRAGKNSISEELGTTQVYKDGNVHKIRFDESWTSADIAVYDLTGRAIYKQEGVKTDTDYVLDLPKTIVYVVKIQSNTGEIVTQKIIR